MASLPERRDRLDLSAIEQSAREAFEQMEKSSVFKAAQESLRKISAARIDWEKAMAPYEEYRKKTSAMISDLMKPTTLVFDPDDTKFLVAPPPRPRYPTAQEVARAVMYEMKLAKPLPKKEKPEKLVPLPGEATWQDIRMDQQETFSIKVFHKGVKVGEYDNVDLELMHIKQGKLVFNKEGEFLNQLALASISKGKFVPTVSEMARALGVKLENCHQIKKNLVKKLKKSFGITSDPFFRYNERSGYIPRFQIRPVPVLRNEELHASGGQLFEDTYQSEDEIDDFLEGSG